MSPLSPSTRKARGAHTAGLRGAGRLAIGLVAVTLAVTWYADDTPLPGTARSVEATPFYSVEAAHRCDTCHIEPLDWYNPEMPDRRCTLDCQGCHISPSGGGMRTPYGRFYGENELPTWGPRPDAGVQQNLTLRPGQPTEGRYQLFRGFEGWWPGDTPHRTVEERVGYIDPSPTWQLGGDLRGMTLVPTDEDEEREILSFPMQVDGYAAWHPVENVTTYISLGLKGNKDDGLGNNTANDDFVRKYLTIREAFAMVHDLPYAGYVRAGRFNLPYGWRIPDHTAYIRGNLGFDQDRQAYGIEAGLAPNYPWANLSFWYQGVDQWPGDLLARGMGVTGQAGVRKLGWQLGGSFHFMQALEDGQPDELMFGPMWGVNLDPVVYLGEIDFRRSSGAGISADSLFAYHELRWTALRGITTIARYEWQDLDLEFKDDHTHRVATGLEWNPIRYLQLQLLWRYAIPADSDINPSELLIQTHAWIF